MSKRYRSGRIIIDVTDVLDEIDDDDLIDEVRTRKLVLSDEGSDKGDVPTTRIVREAYEALQRGNVIEARTLLERVLFPKWGSPKQCADAYDLFKKAAS